eukprot:CAMPEP_0182913112 /NCGR_PEP_ID=MMETSP0034_2-20130328/37867_1 /TAXON_ID=156128 /ORGANISM="Nephroselmis pyriformis, Strain CCMP717" /LENGTH=35 /DNA_ID= /DNA_START= /DNA_END= /DNA_ORIENTATION=
MNGSCVSLHNRKGRRNCSRVKRLAAKKAKVVASWK